MKPDTDVAWRTKPASQEYQISREVLKNSRKRTSNCLQYLIHHHTTPLPCQEYLAKGEKNKWSTSRHKVKYPCPHSSSANLWLHNSYKAILLKKGALSHACAPLPLIFKHPSVGMIDLFAGYLPGLKHLMTLAMINLLENHCPTMYSQLSTYQWKLTYKWCFLPMENHMVK